MGSVSTLHFDFSFSNVFFVKVTKVTAWRSVRLNPIADFFAARIQEEINLEVGRRLGPDTVDRG